MNALRIRPIAIGLIEERGKLFVFEGYDTVKQEHFYRPLGGAIEFGELGKECLAREFQEEIGAELEGITYVGLIENRFTLHGKMGHEIVLVYRARIASLDRYWDVDVTVHEEGGTLTARWIDRADFENGTARLVPEELLDLLEGKDYDG